MGPMILGATGYCCTIGTTPVISCLLSANGTNLLGSVVVAELDGSFISSCTIY